MDSNVFDDLCKIALLLFISFYVANYRGRITARLSYVFRSGTFNPQRPAYRSAVQTRGMSCWWLRV